MNKNKISSNRTKGNKNILAIGDAQIAHAGRDIGQQAGRDVINNYGSINERLLEAYLELNSRYLLLLERLQNTTDI